MLESDDDGEDREWVIMRIHKHIIVVMKPFVSGDWEILADGFKNNKEALFYLPLFNDTGE